VSGFLSMLIYFILSLRYYSIYKKLIVQVISYADVVMFRWIRNFLFAFLLMLLVRLVFYISNFFIENNYWDTWWYFLVFAIIFYYIAITGYANSIETKIAFKPYLLINRPALLLSNQPFEWQNEQNVEEAEIVEIVSAVDEQASAGETLNAWKEKLLSLMQLEKLYEDPELSLAQVAKTLQSNPSFISRIVNQGFEINFNDFVNMFRVEAVKEMLGKGEHKKQTLLAIAFEAGFNSKATFNRAFKKATGQSPKDFINSLK